MFDPTFGIGNLSCHQGFPLPWSLETGINSLCYASRKSGLKNINFYTFPGSRAEGNGALAPEGSNSLFNPTIP